MDRLLDHHTPDQIAGILNEHGLRSGKGRRFTGKRVACLARGDRRYPPVAPGLARHLPAIATHAALSLAASVPDSSPHETRPRAAPIPAATRKTPPPKDGAPGSIPAPNCPRACCARTCRRHNRSFARSPTPYPWPSPCLLSLGPPARHNLPNSARAELSNDQTLPQPPPHGKMPFAGRLR